MNYNCIFAGLALLMLFLRLYILFFTGYGQCYFIEGNSQGYCFLELIR